MIFQHERIQEFKLDIITACETVLVNCLTKLDQLANLVIGAIFSHKEKFTPMGGYARVTQFLSKLKSLIEDEK